MSVIQPIEGQIVFPRDRVLQAAGSRSTIGKPNGGMKFDSSELPACSDSNREAIGEMKQSADFNSLCMFLSEAREKVMVMVNQFENQAEVF